VPRAIRHQIKRAVYRALPRSRLYERGPTTARKIALTFDDGPNDSTLKYLDLLDELDVRATFFVLGASCHARPELAREYRKRGHQIASHGYEHKRFPTLSWAALRDDLDRADAVLGRQSTARPWVRPPHGDVNAKVLANLLVGGRILALWSLDPRDYELRRAEDVVARCAPDRVSAGEVILLHEGLQWTLEALPSIVRGLRGAGYELVTMANMFSA
jgi:peptidoglycan/xylan/chitin deacetylase (PgdA/CDA1 family)